MLDKYNTKLDGVEVCNACYAMVLGYSQRRFKQLEVVHRVYGRVVHRVYRRVVHRMYGRVVHRVYGRVAAVHRNMCNLRERAKMSTAKESFTAFIGDAGCIQPHC
jgi:hypothetical protein